MKNAMVRPLFLVAAGCLALGAQENAFEGALKFRGGFQLASTRDDLSPAIFGAGFEVGYRTPQGTLAGEVGLYYKPGNQHLLPLESVALAPGAAVDPDNSVDSRKNQVDGYYLRLSWARPVFGVAFRAGLEIANAGFRQEYVADLQGTVDGTPYRDTYNGVLQKRVIALSPFVGATWELANEQFVEVQLIAMSYTASHYVHVAGTVGEDTGGHTDQDHATAIRRTVPHLEIAYGIRF